MASRSSSSRGRMSHDEREGKNRSLSRTGANNREDPDLITPERKIRSALKQIQEGFNEKVSYYEGKLLESERKCQKLETRCSELENEVDSLNRLIEKKDTKYQDLDIKFNDTLNDQRNLVLKYNQLRRYAAQLEAFKKKIINVSGSGPTPLDSEFIEHSLAIEGDKLISKKPPGDRLDKIKLDSKEKNILNTSTGINNNLKQNWHSRNGRENDRRNTTHSSKLPLPDLISSPNLNVNNVNNHYVNSKPSNTASFGDNSLLSFNKEMTELSSNLESLRLAQLYEDICQHLDQEAFEEFKFVLDRFNKRLISVEQCLKRLKSIVPDSHDYELLKNAVIKASENGNDPENSQLIEDEIGLASEVGTSF